MSECICDFPTECDGSGIVECAGCGGDLCVCATCHGCGEDDCLGCQYCLVPGDGEP